MLCTTSCVRFLLVKGASCLQPSALPWQWTIDGQCTYFHQIFTICAWCKDHTDPSHHMLQISKGNNFISALTLWHFAKIQTVSSFLSQVACIEIVMAEKNQGYLFLFLDNKPPLDGVLERNGNSKGWYLRGQTLEKLSYIKTLKHLIWAQ